MNYADCHLADPALSRPMATEIFRKNRLDFCCGGRQTLRDACAKQSINLDEIIQQLQKLESEEVNFLQDASLKELTQFIVRRYHTDLRRRFPEIQSLAEKVEKVHSDHPECPRGLHQLLKTMHEEMLMHMMKEENVLFPMIEAGRGSLAAMPIKVMTADHDSHGRQLDEIHRITSDFLPPQDACTSWRALYKGLEKLEEELMNHIHLENNNLFPRALGES